MIKKMMTISEEAKRTVDEIVDDWLSNIDILADAGVIFLDSIGLN
jgi:DNA helicase TIP49 (TBP-interacting protein)